MEEIQSLNDPNKPILGIPLYAMALNWDPLHARLNTHYKKRKKIKAHRKSL